MHFRSRGFFFAPSAHPGTRVPGYREPAFCDKRHEYRGNLLIGLTGGSNLFGGLYNKRHVLVCLPGAY
eukprot:415056-Rhodomonas_salina.2